MKHFFGLSIFVILTNIALEGSQARVVQRRTGSVSQEVELEEVLTEVVQQLGSSAIETEELWIRVLVPDMQQIEKAQDELLKILGARQNSEVEVSCKSFDTEGRLIEGHDNLNPSSCTLLHIKPDELLLLGLSQDDGLRWFLGEALIKRLRELQQNLTLCNLVSNLFSKNLHNQRMQFTEAQSRLFLGLPEDIQRNMRSNFKFDLVESVAKEVAAALAMAQSQAQVPQSSSSASSSSVVSSAAQAQSQDSTLRNRQSTQQQTAQPNQQAAPEQPQPASQENEDGFPWMETFAVIGVAVTAGAVGYGSYALWCAWMA